jgi:hypothetical protein
MRITFWAVAVATLLSGGAWADVWDVGGDNDNDSGSDNELVHGLEQLHDMAARQNGSVEDADWYPLRYACNSSFEVLLDSFTGDISNGTTGSPALDLLGPDGTSVIASSLPVSSLHLARRITHACLSTDQEAQEYVRVQHPHCGLDCTGQDQYRIRFRETTAFVPRFSNAEGQASVLLLENTTAASVVANVVAYDFEGAVIVTLDASLAPNGKTLLNLSATPALAGKSGALKIVHDAPYGALAGKVVAIDPATAFTADTSLVYKPY